MFNQANVNVPKISQGVVNLNHQTMNQSVINSGSTTNPEDSYIIRIDMVDGTYQLLHLSLEQAMALGVHNVCEESKEKSQKQHQLTSTLNTLNYKIVQPEDLNLSKKEEEVIPETLVLKGRPKKRLAAESLKNDVIEKSLKIVNTSRTRCGRITKPPTHIEKDYKKIVTCVKASMDRTKEVDTVEFEPIKTMNHDKEPPPLISLRLQPKKRNIPAQYKCPFCKKAYLGRNRMTLHFKKYPDHKPSSQTMMQDCNTWYYLIETALKANKGKRGEKLCRELVNLVKNIRIMAKNFMKLSSKVERTEYVVDSYLAEILNINEGNYRFNEGGICKDVNIFSYLLDDSFLDKDTSDAHITKPPAIPSEITYLSEFDNSCDQNINKIPCFVSPAPEEHSYSVQSLKERPAIDLHFGSDITDVIGKQLKKEHFSFENTSSSSNKDPERSIDKNNIMHMFTDNFIEKPDVKLTRNSDLVADSKEIEFNSCLFGEKQEVQNDCTEPPRNNPVGKEIDIFRPTIPNILVFGASDEHMSTILDKEKKARKSDEFDLNKLHLVEFLPDAPVNNILDTSTGSDDIMNVDQFVNERFKNLTEPEDMQNIQVAPISLDLSVLDPNALF